MNEVWHGECAALMRDRLSEESVDLIVTSPPYDELRDYKGYSFDFESIAEQMLRVLKVGGVAVWVVGDKVDGGRSMTSFRHGIAFQEMGFVVHDVMIYAKRNTPFPRSNSYTPAHELMFVLSKGGPPKTFTPLTMEKVESRVRKAWTGRGKDGSKAVEKEKIVGYNDRCVRTNIWEYSVGLGCTTGDEYAFGHPAMFPEKLARDHIQSWSAPGDLVLDPMCGSGTTLKMAKRYGRRWLGIDISDEYVGIARRRVADEQDSLF